jgi:hypothetical protein
MTISTCAEARDALNEKRVELSEIVEKVEHTDPEQAPELQAVLIRLRGEEAAILSWMDNHQCDEVDMPGTKAINLNQITIHDVSGVKNVPKFTAPEESLAARALWAFLVEHLRGGFVVELEIPEDGLQVEHETGSPLPLELYKRILRGAAEGDEI